ncbi:hypothetical protein BpHYR1_048643 [Brachionus plicatilis]|uniref:Uncharacterized protein n=1 Tax=Brachionus plicatilis TaxID=10195 RepID=A0A3M7R7K5_BRAPC|nr:hypothetical protein BpHYR1_048643 [Brachionus plicatilis]
MPIVIMPQALKIKNMMNAPTGGCMFRPILNIIVHSTSDNSACAKLIYIVFQVEHTVGRVTHALGFGILVVLVRAVSVYGQWVHVSSKTGSVLGPSVVLSQLQQGLGEKHYRHAQNSHNHKHHLYYMLTRIESFALVILVFTVHYCNSSVFQKEHQNIGSTCTCLFIIGASTFRNDVQIKTNLYAFCSSTLFRLFLFISSTLLQLFLDSSSTIPVVKERVEEKKYT